MNVLVIGNGGREHALAWKIAQSPRTERVFVAPGNAGTAGDAENVNIAADDFPTLVKFVQDNEVALTVVGPEAPLADGIVDAFEEERLRILGLMEEEREAEETEAVAELSQGEVFFAKDARIFGPNKAAAELEASKVFCKNLLRDADVPSADYQVFSEPDLATKYLQERESVPIVVKADGLAAGKGVIVCPGRDEALQAVDTIARERAFGDAGNRLVIEERLDGQEVSVLAVTDGKTLVTLQPAQDHKAAYDGDTGPNTGGMGAYCPAPLVDDRMLHWVEEKILVPTVHAMKWAGRPFAGVLYAGLMITNQGPKVLEYNVRFGDPECQPLLMRLRTDLVDVLEAAVEGHLDKLAPLDWDPRPAVCVVMASEGYPGSYQKGHPIRGLDNAAKLPDTKVFHAGTKQSDDRIVTAGGRVLNVTALGDNIARAKLNAYTAVKCIRWDGAWCRKDISDKALA